MLVQRWTSKPWPGVGLDWTHPLTRGLIGCWIFNEHSGPNTYNFGSTGPRDNGVLTNAPTWVGSPSGGGIACASANTSFVALGNFPEFNSAVNASLFGIGNRAAGTIWELGLLNSGSSAFAVQIWSDNVYYMLVNGEFPTATGAAPTGDFSVGFTFDGTQAQAVRGQSYVNGASRGAGSFVTTSLGAVTSIAAAGHAVDYTNGRFDVVMMWAGRTLTSQDMSDLHTNPWQIFQPNQSYWLFQPSGVESDTGSGTITAVATIAATGLVTDAVGVAGITATATIAATGLVTDAVGVGGISAAATISATGLATYTGSAGISAAATIAATGLVTAAIGEGGISASATIAATGLATYTGSGGIDATATIAATGLVTDATGVAGISAAATIEATGTVSGVLTGSGTITAAATIAATGLVTDAIGVAGISAAATIAATGTAIEFLTGSAGISASATIAATGLITAASGVAGITATATISASGISSSAVVFPEIYPDPFAAALLTTSTPFSAALSTTSTPFGATSTIGLATSPKLTGRWYHLQGGGVTTLYATQLQKTFPTAVAEGSLIIVNIGNDTSGGTFTVLDSINNTPYAVAISGGGSLSSGTATILWYVVPQGGGGYPFTVTFNSQNGTYPVMSIDEYRPPVGCVPSIESFGAAEGNSTTATIASPLPITHTDLVVATCKAWGENGQTITPTAGFQTRYEVLWSSSPPTNGLITADELNTNVDTTPSFSLDPGSNWVIATAAFTPTPMPSYSGSAEITATGTIAATGSITYESFMLLGLI